MESLSDRAPTFSRRVIGVDFETTSAADLKAVGAWQYSRHPSTRLLVAVFAIAERPGAYDYERWSPGEPLPELVLDELAAGTRLLAFNCAFERAMWAHVMRPRHAWPEVPLRAWADAQPLGLALGLPPKLEGLAAALGCVTQKDVEGAALMRRMAVSTWCDDTGDWICPELTPANLRRLGDYCERDVGATLDAWFAMPPLSALELLLWRLDQRINQRGVWLDQPFAQRLRRLAVTRQAQLTDAAFVATGGELANATSTPALKTFLTAHGVKLPKIARKRADGRFEATETAGKAAVLKVLESTDLDPVAREVLELRGEANKATSLAKLARVPLMVDERDGRLRDALHFAGAHTGRWTSSGLQVHNLPKSKLSPATADCVRAIVDAGDIDLLLKIDTAEDGKPGGKAPRLRPLEALSQSLRSVFAAAPGHELIGADFSAIEARVCAWLAEQLDIVQFFRTYDDARARGEKPQDLYQFTAAKIGSTERQLGKVAALALQYGMGDLTFATTAAGWGVTLTPLQARNTKKAWRAANPGIVGWWGELEAAFALAISEPNVLHWAGRVAFRGDRRCVHLVLPSGRCLHYWRPRIAVTTKRLQVVDDAGVVSTKEIEAETLQFWTVAKDKKSMAREDTYGGKLAENATQAVARDLLGEALLRLDAAGYPIVLHVHDSVLAEVKAGTGDVAAFCAQMSRAPSWAADLPVAADGYRDRRFKG